MNDEKTKYAKNGKLPIVIALVIVLGLVGFRMVSLFTPDDKVEEEPISVEFSKAKMMDNNFGADSGEGKADRGS